MPSLAANPQRLTETPADGADTLSAVLRSVRLSGSLQFCVAASTDWETDDKPGMARLTTGSVVPFHVLVSGSAWVRIGESTTQLVPGDIIAFPFATGHAIGTGRGGTLVAPSQEIPRGPFGRVPVVRYGDDPPRTRLLCGYLRCEALEFRPLAAALPQMLHLSSGYPVGDSWASVTVRQMVAEADTPSPGGLSLLERLSESLFIELLRQCMADAAGTGGWLAALADPHLARCLTAIHSDPDHDWSIADLTAAAGLSRSTLTARFAAVLDTTPSRYVADWRLFRARQALRTTSRRIASIAYDAGYSSEAAFNRAFTRAFGIPPARWRQDSTA